MRAGRTWTVAVAAVAAACGADASPDPPSPSAGDSLGVVRFATSAAPGAQAPFLRGVAALHSFAYEEAAAAFVEARAADPGFALAYWGEALTRFRPLLGDPDDRDAMRRVLARLGATLEERAARARDPRERAYLAAVEVLAGEGEWQGRKEAYRDAMAALAERWPDDPEARLGYALALFGVTDPARRSAEVMEEVAAICAEVLRGNPDHPGALHYLIHALDTPGDARRALDAARTYARVAPAAPHALHMPSHVFLQLGMWEEVVASNRAAWDASLRRAGARDYHALSWLPYALDQLGRTREADSVVEELGRRAGAADDDGTTGWWYTNVLGRHVLDSETWWSEPLPLSRWRTRDELFARGWNALRTGDLAEARRMAGDLGAGYDTARRADSASANTLWWGMAVRELDAALASQRGDETAARTALRSASLLEDRLGPPNELPIPFKPLPEVRGEVLLGLGRAREAAVAFEEGLERYPGRARLLAGLARAREAARLAPSPPLRLY